MKFKNLFYTFIWAFCFININISCSKNQSLPNPIQPLPEEVSAPPKEVPPDLEIPQNQNKKYNLNENLISNLIKEVQSTRLLSSDSSDPLLEEQKTRNLTTANTLNKVRFSLDSQKNPLLQIDTQEGNFELHLQNKIIANNKTYYVLTSETSWMEDLFSDSPITYRAFVEVRGLYNNVAIIDLTRIHAPFESTVHIIYLKKFGELQFQSNISSPDLLRDSKNILSDLNNNKTVVAHFYHVITDYENLNSSQATRFSLFFNIFFSLHSHPAGYTDTGSIPMTKSRIYFGEYETRSKAPPSQAKNIADNLNALRQGHIHSILSAEYIRSEDSKNKYLIEQKKLLLNLKMKNTESAESPSQNISVEVEFQ